MAVNTILLDLSVDPSSVKNESQISIVSSNIENILRDFLPNLKQITTLGIEDGLFKLYTCDKGATINLRIYNNGLVTITVEYFLAQNGSPLLSFTKCKEIERIMKEKLEKSRRSQVLVPIKRCLFDRYFPTSDERLLEYDIDDLVFEEISPYQKVQIVHSKTLGNMLVLDDLQNIAEADLIYTETLMARGKEDYTDKEVIILGGGDGALLYELLKENPREVIMLEIDETVMKACSKYMRSICGDVLDKYEGPNYKIKVGDCMKTLDSYIKEGRKFDYIFGDLTDVPISEETSSELWTFINAILQKAFKVMKPNGKFMTHLIGSILQESIDQYIEVLKKLHPPVKYTTSNAFVPSFLEDWVFCQVSLDHSRGE